MLYLAQQPKVQNPQTQRALHAADGYLYLGMKEEALEELDGVEMLEQGDPALLLARVRVLLHMRRWEEAEKLSNRCLQDHPAVEEFTVQRAFALHQMKKGEEAMDVILSAPEWIRRTGIIHYNLACYEARLGSKKMAKRCMDVAIQMNGAMKRNAKVDPDLQGLYN